jgi:hypothetical protein
MTLLTRARLGLVMALAVPLLVWGCTHDYGSLQKADGGANCPAGTETCACNLNRTCDVGLICYSNHCVQPGTGSGGSVGAGGSLGAGGASGLGGVLGSGGSVGQGGVTGAGGVLGSGGVTGAGGIVASGGVTGAGGIVASGGVTGAGGIVASGGVTGTGGSVPPVANNQIVNGDFSSGSAAPWGITVNSPSGASLSGTVTNGQFCVAVPVTDYAITIGWPASGSPVAVLQAGVTYELTYQISTSASFYTWQVKVGQATSPFTQVDYQTPTTQPFPVAGVGLQTFSHLFAPTTADPVAGVAFNIGISSATTICLDNVALGTPN